MFFFYININFNKKNLNIYFLFFFLYLKLIQDAFKEVESKYRNGKITRSKINKIFKKLNLDVTKDELDKAAFLIGGYINLSFLN